MQTLIIETKKETDFQLFVSLARRLKVKFREEQMVVESKVEKDQTAFLSLFGSFKDIDSDTIIKEIEVSRTTKEIATSWVK